MMVRAQRRVRSSLLGRMVLWAALTATAVMGPAATGTATAAPEPVVFTTPSGNIACMISPGFSDIAPSVRCDIATFTYTPPPAPPDCHAVFGHSISLQQGRPPEFGCAHDTMVLSHYPTTGYGDSAQQGPFRCDSTTEGVLCTDNTSHHSFRLSRESYDLS
jgi:hypothetical protein